MRLSVVAVIVLLLGFGLKYGIRQEFVVHKEGVIVITGASTGIGRHAAVQLAHDGYVVFAGVRKESDSASILAQAEKENIKGKLRPITVDVTSQADIDRVHEEVVAFLSQNPKLPFVALVNNAGVSFTAPLESTPLDAAKNVWDINYWGTLATTQKFLPLIRQHKGRVVSVSSLMGLIALAGSTTYSGTKWAMEAAMDALRLEVQPFGVSVSVVEPGYIKTAIAEKGAASRDLVSSEQYELYRSFWEKSLSSRANNFASAPGPEITTEVIKDAIVNPFPETRYPVGGGRGFPAKLLANLAVLLPDRLLDILRTRT